MSLRIHTFTPEELADDSLHAQMARPSNVVPGVPYLLTESPTFMGLSATTGIPLTELRDALAALDAVPRPTTVAEWNERALARRQAMKENVGVRGLACSKCGVELVDTQPNWTLASSPPKKRLDCPACENIEYIYV